MAIDKRSIEEAVKRILVAIGEDPEREGLRETPRRVANMFEEVLGGYNAEDEYTLFTESSDLVVLGGVKFFSLCEHHLLPFFGLAHIAYLPRGKVVGLSKLARIVNKYARRLQVQERMTEQIADEIRKATNSEDVMVVTEAYHLCMIMRGVRNASPTVVAALRGAFREDSWLKNEVYDIIRPYRIGRFPF